MEFDDDTVMEVVPVPFRRSVLFMVPLITIQHIGEALTDTADLLTAVVNSHIAHGLQQDEFRAAAVREIETLTGGSDE